MTKTIYLWPVIGLLACCMLVSCSKKDAASEEASDETATEMNEDGVSASDAATNASEGISSEDEMAGGMSDDAESMDEVPNTMTDAEGNIIYLTAEVQPAFPGGEDEMYSFLRKNLKYPEEAKKNEHEGTVHVSFIVDETGDIRNAEVVKPAEDPLLNEEALRVVSEMPPWNPGKQNGEDVHVKYTLPIRFALR